MADAFTNFAKSTLVGGLAPATTTLTVQAGDGALFPAAGAGQTFRFVLQNAANQREVCICTLRTGDVFNTITRNAEGTTALTWNAGDRVGHRLTAAQLNNILVSTDLQQNTKTWCGTAGGTVNALTLTPTPAVTAMAAGHKFIFKTSGVNTTPATMSVSGLATFALQNNGVALNPGDLEASKWYEVLYDGAAGQLKKFAFVGAGNDGDELFSLLGASAGVWLKARLVGSPIINGKIVRSVSAGALTVALKTMAGTDPTALSPVFVLVPTQTTGSLDGGYAMRKVTGALSTVVSSGSTLGHINAVASPVYTYLIDNGGSLELANSNKFFGYNTVQSSTAEGGAGAADSGTVLYSTTARASMVVTCVQRWKSTQAAAGTWADTTGEVQLVPFPFKRPTLTTLAATGNYVKPWDMLTAVVELVGGGAGGGGSTATGGGQNSAGTGGGAGGYCLKTIDAAIIPSTFSVTIGASAAGGGAGASGTGGNTSTWADGTNTLTAGGGGAGVGGGATGNSQPTGTGGSSGVATGGDVNIPGGGGCPGFVSPATNNPVGGKGGSSHLSNAPQYSSQDATGVAGLAYGGGGGGSASSGASGGQSGGAGASGIALIQEMYQAQ